MPLEITSFCLLVANASSSSIQSLIIDGSSSFSEFNYCASLRPMHLKGEREMLDFAKAFSILIFPLETAWEEASSCLTCCTMASRDLNCIIVTWTVVYHLWYSWKQHIWCSASSIVFNLVLVFTFLCLNIQFQFIYVRLALFNLWNKKHIKLET